MAVQSPPSSQATPGACLEHWGFSMEILHELYLLRPGHTSNCLPHSLLWLCCQSCIWHSTLFSGCLMLPQATTNLLSPWNHRRKWHSKVLTLSSGLTQLCHLGQQTALQHSFKWFTILTVLGMISRHGQVSMWMSTPIRTLLMMASSIGLYLLTAPCNIWNANCKFAKLIVSPSV